VRGLVVVRVSRVDVDDIGLYRAGLEVSYSGRVYEFKVERLLRRPVRAKAKIEGEILVINLEDGEGKPLSTCCIHVGHLEKGCVDCRNLLTPPSCS
jgi:hypothetical protein